MNSINKNNQEKSGNNTTNLSAPPVSKYVYKNKTYYFISEMYYSEKNDLEREVKKIYGNNAEVCDWSEIKYVFSASYFTLFAQLKIN